MPLEGRLEDTNLLEVLQIIAFAGRTGTLTIESARASGTLLFVSGTVRCALSSSTLPHMSALSKRPATDYPGLLLHDGIRATLHELCALREGEFSFSVSSALPADYAGVELTKFVESEGVEPQQLFLDLARDFDTARRRIIAILGSTDPSTDASSHEISSGAPNALDDIRDTVTDPSRPRSKGLTRVLSRIATRYSERCVIFLVEGCRIRGLSSMSRDRPQWCQPAHEIELDREALAPFANAVYSAIPESRHGHDAALASHLGSGSAKDYALFPVLYHHEVVALLLCDNDVSGAPLGNTDGLALFVRQAGSAMEKATLERRLAAMAHPLSLANQGPLVQVALAEN